MDGLEAARELRERFPDVGVIMLTAYDDRQFVVEAVRSGARGYVLKARDAEHLIQTVRLVAGGNMVIDPQLVVALAAHDPSAHVQALAALARAIAEPVRLQSILSATSASEIAAALEESEAT